MTHTSDTPRRLATALADHYRIERELGAGGMATVYLAEDVKHGRRVAVKALHPELAAALGAERFLAEIKTTANLQHAHILPLHDSGEADGFLFYVMPYVAGETLHARLERETQPPLDDALRIAVARSTVGSHGCIAPARHSQHSPSRASIATCACRPMDDASLSPSPERREVTSGSSILRPAL